MIEVKRQWSNGCESCPELWDGTDWIATIPGSPHLGFDSVARAEALARKLNALDGLLASYVELLSYVEAERGWAGEPDDQVEDWVLRARQALRAAMS